MFQKSDDTMILKIAKKFFGIQNPKEISHQMIMNVSTSLVNCSHCTLWKADNVHLIEASTKTHCRY